MIPPKGNTSNETRIAVKKETIVAIATIAAPLATVASCAVTMPETTAGHWVQISQTAQTTTKWITANLQASYAVSMPIWGWAIAILAIPILISIGIITLRFARRQKTTTPRLPDFWAFRETEWRGIKLKWRYTKAHDGRYDITEIRRLCAQCETPLIPTSPIIPEAVCVGCETRNIVPNDTEVKAHIQGIINRQTTRDNP